MQLRQFNYFMVFNESVLPGESSLTFSAHTSSYMLWWCVHRWCGGLIHFFIDFFYSGFCIPNWLDIIIVVASLCVDLSCSICACIYLRVVSKPLRFGQFCFTTVPAGVAGQHNSLSHVQLQYGAVNRRREESHPGGLTINVVFRSVVVLQGRCTRENFCI